MTDDLDRFTRFYTEVLGATIVFEESTPQLRHAVLAVGGVNVLHPVQPVQPHGAASDAMFRGGHLDHLALDVPS